MAGMGTKRIRVANLPPEVHNNTLHESLASLGKVLNIHAETWTRIYRYPVSNGVRQVVMHLTRHLPSHLTIAGYTVLISYEGQPATYNGCGAVGHCTRPAPHARQTRRRGKAQLKPRTHPLPRTKPYLLAGKWRTLTLLWDKMMPTTPQPPQQQPPSYRIGKQPLVRRNKNPP